MYLAEEGAEGDEAAAPAARNEMNINVSGICISTIIVDDVF